MSDFLIKSGSITITSEKNPDLTLHIVRKSFFQKEAEVIDMKFDDICLCYAVKTLYKKWVCIGTIKKKFSIKLSIQKANQLVEYIEANNPLYKKDGFTSYTFRTISHLITPENLWLTPKACSYVHIGLFAKYLIGVPKVSIVSIPEVVFYNYSGLIFKKLYFGRYSQILMGRPTLDFENKLKDYLVEHGAKIGIEAADTYKGSMLWNKFYNPAEWFKHESIGLTDEALVFNRKTFTSVDTNYIEYEKMDVAMKNDLGWAQKGLLVFGELNAISQQRFSSSDLDKIFEKLKEKGVRVPKKSGDKVYKPSCLWFEWFWNIFKSPVKVYSDELFLYVKPGRLGGLYDVVDPDYLFDDLENIEEAKEALDNIKRFRFKSFAGVRKGSYVSHTFNKAHFWDFWGVATIKFKSVSIRTDQSNGGYYYLVITNISKSKLDDLIGEIKNK